MLWLCVLLNKQLKSQLKKVNQRLLLLIRSHMWSLLSACLVLMWIDEVEIEKPYLGRVAVFSDFTASLEDLWYVLPNQTSFVWKVTVGVGTGFVLCLSCTIIWPVLNGGRLRL